MGITKLAGITAEELKRPRKKLPLEEKAAALPAATPGSLPASSTILSAAEAPTSP